MQNLITIKSFTNEEDFILFKKLLEAHSIPFESQIFNSSINEVSLAAVEKEFNIKVDISDLSAVNELLDKIAIEEVKTVDKSHYLFSFTDEELFEILTKPDEWSAFDFQLSKSILKDRGRKIDDELLNALKKSRYEEISKPEESQSNWIIIGYISAILGGLLGIGIGFSIISSQKTLPNGEKIYSYNEKDRMHGRWIFYLGIFMFLILLLFRLWETASSL